MASSTQLMKAIASHETSSATTVAKARECSPTSDALDSAPGSIPGRISEEETVCPICFDELDHPVTLPCNHTFCRDCLRKLRSNGRTFRKRCPLCRAVLPRTSHVGGHRHTLFDLEGVDEDEFEFRPGVWEYFAIAILSTFGCLYCCLVHHSSRDDTENLAGDGAGVEDVAKGRQPLMMDGDGWVGPGGKALRATMVMAGDDAVVRGLVTMVTVVVDAFEQVCSTDDVWAICFALFVILSSLIHASHRPASPVDWTTRAVDMHGSGRADARTATTGPGEAAARNLGDPSRRRRTAGHAAARPRDPSRRRRTAGHAAARPPAPASADPASADMASADPAAPTSEPYTLQ
jgi:hypothetical protein